jgi:hypothetical protein
MAHPRIQARVEKYFEELVNCPPSGHVLENYAAKQDIQTLRANRKTRRWAAWASIVLEGF